MKMRNLLALLTAVLLLPTQNIPVHAEQKEFQVGVDSWLMQNSPFSLGNYYRLTEHDESIMKSNFSNTEQKRFNDAMSQKWQGCCYGIAVTSLLCYYGVFQPSDYWETAEHLYDVEITEPLVSLINYYQQAQCADACRQARAWSLYHETSDERLAQIIASVKAGKPALVAYVGHFRDLPDMAGHAVAAFGYETGSWEWDEQKYNARILIYDPNTYLFEDSACLYIDTEHGNWRIPAYKLNSEDGDIIDFVSSDIELLNNCGLIHGTKYHSDKPRFAFFGTVLPKGVFSFKKTQFDGNTWTDTEENSDIRKFQYSFGKSMTLSDVDYIMPDQESGYYFTVEQEQPLDVNMSYDNLLMIAEGTGKTVRFSPDGTFAMESSGQPYTLEIVRDTGYSGTMYDLTFSGSAKSVQISVTENGYLLLSDQLEEITVKGNGDNTEDTLCFSTEADKVLISETEDHTLAAAVDTDGDGKFETILERLYRTGDVNSDGSINARDATEILIASAHIGTGKDTGMTEAQQKAADVNADGSINAIDATWILRYAAAGGTGTAPESLADYIEKR